jgi:hypothetical protein
MRLEEFLAKAYQDELLDALRAERAAEGVPYPHVRALLLEVAKGSGPTRRPSPRP